MDETHRMKQLFVPGVFDVFHVGHLNYLKNASRHGGRVIVGVQDDRSVFESKGVKPVIPLAERMAIIEELRFVDEVVSYTSVFQGPLLTGLGIDVFAVGDEYGQDDRYPDQKRTLAFCRERGIEVVHLPRTPHVSSTNIRSRLKEFWNERAKLQAEISEGVTMLGSFGGDQKKIIEETRQEVELILSAVENAAEKSLLDLGCGDGRHLAHLCGPFRQTTGVDFSPQLLEIAARRLAERGYAARLIEADVSQLCLPEQFDVLLLSGITPCLDDGQMAGLLEGIRQMSHGQSRLLMRGSIGVQGRIDVVNQFSLELNARYTAFYRTVEETERLFAQAGWRLARHRPLYQHRSDTAVWWFEFEASRQTVPLALPARERQPAAKAA